MDSSLATGVDMENALNHACKHGKGTAQGLETTAVGGEQSPRGEAATAEATRHGDVIQQRLDLQINTNGGQAWLELRQPFAHAWGLDGKHLLGFPLTCRKERAPTKRPLM